MNHSLQRFYVHYLISIIFAKSSKSTIYIFIELHCANTSMFMKNKINDLEIKQEEEEKEGDGFTILSIT